MVFVTYDQGRTQGVGWGVCIPFTSRFQLLYVFDKYNFSMFSNLFDNNKPHALSTHN